MGWISGLGRYPGEGHDNSLDCSCLENPMDREAWWATAHRVTKNWTRLKRPSMHTTTDPFTTPIVLPFLECHTVGIMQYVVFFT